jgi:hypothetical protein
LEATSKITSESVDPLSLGLQSIHHLGHARSSYGEGPPGRDGPVGPLNPER